MDEYFIGVDDAGRGPVIGPMILAGILIKKEEEKELKKLGVKDSKQLFPSTRKRIGDELKKKYKYFLQEVSPKEIDDCVNLNILEAERMAVIINALSKDIDGKITAFVDCPSTNIKKWKSLLKNLLLRNDIELVIEHKADVKYPVVSAASIIAKEKREEEVRNLKRKFNVDFGSGYPSDPITIDFIKKNFSNKNFNEIIRFSWATVKNLKEKQRKLF